MICYNHNFIYLQVYHYLMVGFETIFYFAMELKRMEDLKMHLKVHFNGVSLVALYFENKVEEKRVKKTFFIRVSKIVKDLNSEIKIFNKQLKNNLGIIIFDAHPDCDPNYEYNFFGKQNI